MNSYWPGILLEPSVLTLDNIQCVLADQSGSMPCTPCTATSPSLPRTMPYLREQNVRFDITVIPPGTAGGEYVKTRGRYHPQSPSGID